LNCHTDAHPDLINGFMAEADAPLQTQPEKEQIMNMQNKAREGRRAALAGRSAGSSRDRDAPAAIVTFRSSRAEGARIVRLY
jgi:hypothetical protein